MISLVDLPEVEMLVTLVEVVWLFVEVLKMIQLDKRKLISLTPIMQGAFISELFPL
ncbi:hypothetical protein [Sutcliffiella horikoshii]|uniref:hypothetical protein n=1 Tax=Sutcliffiella horikoshii TaxID=79883 RepID=UPI0016535943|nr:hypothetical protein [Sutcliffiella horikoshii]